MLNFKLIRYHNGWLTLQRRRVNFNRNHNQANNQNNRANLENNRNFPRNIENNNINPNENDNSNQATQREQNQAIAQPLPQSPNFLRLIVTFILTFFTSLIPERPRAAN